MYPIVHIDAIFVSTREGVQVQKRAFYVALGVQTDGTRDVLGFWAAASEGAKFWLGVLTDLKNRGVTDVLFICADGLTGLSQAIGSAFPNAVHQTCVVHLIRNALRFVNWKDRAEVTKALKTVYTAPNAEAAADALDVVEARYKTQYPRVARTFRDRWEDFVPFLSYPAEIRRMLYTTNAIESLNAQLRKFLGGRGPFPNDDAVFKLLFLGIRQAKVHWKRPVHWRTIYSQFDIYFEGRLPA